MEFLESHRAGCIPDQGSCMPYMQAGHNMPGLILHSRLISEAFTHQSVQLVRDRYSQSQSHSTSFLSYLNLAPVHAYYSNFTCLS